MDTKHGTGENGRRARGRAAWLLGLVGALAIGGAAAASGATSRGAATPVARAQLAAEVEPVEIRSGDDQMHHDEPDAVSPAVPLEAGRNRMTEDSPWSGLWGPDIEPLATYDPQWRCLSGARPAVTAFAQLLEAAYPQGRDLGISRDCEAGARSEHKEGRAYDWGVRVTSPAERMAAEELVAWLLATDEHGNDFAMARRLGVMYVIWDGHIWSASAARDGWRVYQGASPHTDHVHLSFSWEGALGTTSFWDAARVGPWLLGPVAVDRLPSSFDVGRDRYRSELGEEPGSLQVRGAVPEAEERGTHPATSETSPGDEPAAPAPVPSAPVPPQPDAAPAAAPTDVLVVPLPAVPLPTLSPVAPADALSDPGAVVEEVVEAVGDVADDLGGTADALLGGGLRDR